MMTISPALRRTMLALVTVGALGMVSACDDEGPAERAGKKLDNAVEEMGDKIEDATDN